MRYKLFYEMDLLFVALWTQCYLLSYKSHNETLILIDLGQTDCAHS